MNLRVLFIAGGAVACLATLICLLVQGRQLATLRAEEQDLVSKSRLAEATSRRSPMAAPTPETSELRVAASPSFELLRLRSEVNRLRTRRYDLFSVTNENVQLRAQLRDRATNTPTATALPPGYILRSQAQYAGCNTPEATMQSFLWALQNRDFNILLQTLTPESIPKMESQVRQGGNSTNEFFNQAAVLAGMAILERRQLPDGSIMAKVQIVPGIPPEKIRFQPIGGQWKIQFPR